MTDSSVLALLRNAALLVAMAVVFDVATSRLRPDGRPIRAALAGAIMGLIGIAVMADSFRFGDGIIFDMRSVLLAVSGLFLGAIPAAVAMGMTAAFRFYEGGAAEWAGVAVILATGSLGVAWRHYRRGPLARITTRELYGFGVVVHLVMLAVLLATLPSGTAWRMLRNIGLPILLVYPLATTALGLMLASRLRRERMAAELAASETRFRTFFNQSPVGMGMIAPDGTLMQANPAFAQLVGYPSEELANLTLESIVHPDDVGKSRECAGNLLAGERDACCSEQRWLTKDGRTILVQVHARLERDGEGRPLQFLAVFFDMTERKQSEAALEQLLERFRLANLATFDVVWEWDVQANTFWRSRNFDSTFGDLDEEIGAGTESWVRRIHPEDRASVEMGIHEAISSGAETWSAQYRFRRGDGAYAVVLDRAFISRDEQGQPRRMIGAMEDITDRTLAEAKLAEQLDELNRWRAATIGREGRVLELKREVNDLLAQSGEPPRYPSAVEEITSGGTAGGSAPENTTSQ